MKKRRIIGTAASALFITLYTVYLIVFGSWAKEDAEKGLRLCADVILKTVMPFSVASSLIVSSGLCGAAGRLLGAPFSRLLGLSDDGAGVFFLGLIGGYPSGAVSAGELYSKGAISRDEAERLISFTNNATPAFAAGFCGSVLGDARCGALLYSVCIVSSVVWGVMIRKKAGKREKSKLRLSVPRLSSAVLSASSSCVVICADVIVFSIISGALSRLPLGFVIPALFEVTGGAVSLAAHVRDLRLCGSAVCALVSFSGLCVADQTDGVCRGYGLSPGYYLAGKPVQAVLSFLLYYLSYPLIIS